MPEHRIASTGELLDETVRKADVGGTAIALVKTGGKLHALADRCPHAGGPLSEGILENGALRCPWHERHFDPATGVCVDHPATRAVACFPLRIEADGVFVTLPPPPSP